MHFLSLKPRLNYYYATTPSNSLTGVFILEHASMGPYPFTSIFIGVSYATHEDTPCFCPLRVVPPTSHSSQLFLSLRTSSILRLWERAVSKDSLHRFHVCFISVAPSHSVFDTPTSRNTLTQTWVLQRCVDPISRPQRARVHYELRFQPHARSVAQSISS